MKSIGKHITLYQPHVDVLDSIIKNEMDVTNYSEAIRFLCMTYEKKATNSSAHESVKLNAMSKEISILSVLVGELGAYQILDEDILSGTQSKPYLKAKRIVEEEIKRKQTEKYSNKKKQLSAIDTLRNQLNQ